MIVSKIARYISSRAVETKIKLINYSYSCIVDDEDGQRKKKKIVFKEIGEKKIFTYKFIQRTLVERIERLRKWLFYGKSVRFELLREFLQRKGTVFFIIVDTEM